MELEKATLAGGCFWCTEAIFKRVKGVEKVTSGYTGGNKENPTYHEVSEGITGHAEAVQIEFDPSVITYPEILEIFWHTHDPTTKNQQGADIGTQYRSAVFYHNEKQKVEAERIKSELEEKKTFPAPIVTEIAQFTHFYPAEDYHKNYFENNKNAPYCQLVIDPKVKKLISDYSKNLKEEYKSA